MEEKADLEKNCSFAYF